MLIRTPRAGEAGSLRQIQTNKHAPGTYRDHHKAIDQLQHPVPDVTPVALAIACNN